MLETITGFNALKPSLSGNRRYVAASPLPSPRSAPLTEKQVRLALIAGPVAILEIGGGTAMNCVLKHGSDLYAGANLFKQQMVGPNWKPVMRAGYVECILHRAGKMELLLKARELFSAEKVGSVGSLILPPVTIWAAEAAFLTPVQRAMINVQQGSAPNMLSVFRNTSLPKLYSNWQSLAGKGFTFTFGQNIGLRIAEQRIGKPFKEMSPNEKFQAGGVGALFGTLASMPATTLFYNGGDKSFFESLKQLGSQEFRRSFYRQTFGAAFGIKVIQKIGTHSVMFGGPALLLAFINSRQQS